MGENYKIYGIKLLYRCRSGQCKSQAMKEASGIWLLSIRKFVF